MPPTDNGSILTVWNAHYFAINQTNIFTIVSVPENFIIAERNT
jgi:hypothetical protein